MEQADRALQILFQMTDRTQLYTISHTKTGSFLRFNAKNYLLFPVAFYHRTAKKNPASSGSGMNLPGMKKNIRKTTDGGKVW